MGFSPGYGLLSRNESQPQFGTAFSLVTVKIAGAEARHFPVLSGMAEAMP